MPITAPTAAQSEIINAAIQRGDTQGLAEALQAAVSAGQLSPAEAGQIQRLFGTGSGTGQEFGTPGAALPDFAMPGLSPWLGGGISGAGQAPMPAYYGGGWDGGWGGGAYDISPYFLPPGERYDPWNFGLRAPYSIVSDPWAMWGQGQGATWPGIQPGAAPGPGAEAIRALLLAQGNQNTSNVAPMLAQAVASGQMTPAQAGEIQTALGTGSGTGAEFTGGLPGGMAPGGSFNFATAAQGPGIPGTGSFNLGIPGLSLSALGAGLSIPSLLSALGMGRTASDVTGTAAKTALGIAGVPTGVNFLSLLSKIAPFAGPLGMGLSAWGGLNSLIGMALSAQGIPSTSQVMGALSAFAPNPNDVGLAAEGKQVQTVGTGANQLVITQDVANAINAAIAAGPAAVASLANTSSDPTVAAVAMHVLTAMGLSSAGAVASNPSAVGGYSIGNLAGAMGITGVQTTAGLGAQSLNAQGVSLSALNTIAGLLGLSPTATNLSALGTLSTQQLNQLLAAGPQGIRGVDIGAFNPNITLRSCFPGGTPVLIGDGSVKPIQQVQVGDHVWSYDLDAQCPLIQTVKGVRSGPGHEFCRINGLRVTRRHWMALAADPALPWGRRWKRAERVVPGDQLIDETGKPVPVWSVEREPCAEMVYNLGVWSIHPARKNFFVSDGDHFYCVHNGDGAASSSGDAGTSGADTGGATGPAGEPGAGTPGDAGNVGADVGTDVGANIGGTAPGEAGPAAGPGATPGNSPGEGGVGPGSSTGPGGTVGDVGPSGDEKG